MVKRKSPKEALAAKKSWQLVKKNKILFFPNMIILLVNFLLLFVLFTITNLWPVLTEGGFVNLKETVGTSLFVVSLIIYFIITLLFDNFLLAMKYGMIKKVVQGKKAKLKQAFAFAKKYYFSVLGVLVVSYLIILIPLILLATVFLLLLPTNPLLSITLFVPLMISYLVFIVIRLLFVYPVMAFEKKGAYQSIKEDFHFVKTHSHHTILTWLIIFAVGIFSSIIKRSLEELSNYYLQQTYFFAVLVVVVILGIELVVSVWEHVYVFKSYLIGKKK